MHVAQAMRQADDDFAQAVYQTSRRAFSRTLREALEAWDANTAAKVWSLRTCVCLCALEQGMHALHDACTQATCKAALYAATLPLTLLSLLVIVRIPS